MQLLLLVVGVVAVEQEVVARTATSIESTVAAHTEASATTEAILSQNAEMLRRSRYFGRLAICELHVLRVSMIRPWEMLYGGKVKFPAIVLGYPYLLVLGHVPGTEGVQVSHPHVRTKVNAELVIEAPHRLVTLIKVTDDEFWDKVRKNPKNMEPAQYAEPLQRAGPGAAEALADAWEEDVHIVTIQEDLSFREAKAQIDTPTLQVVPAAMKRSSQLLTSFSLNPDPPFPRGFAFVDSELLGYYVDGNVIPLPRLDELPLYTPSLGLTWSRTVNPALKTFVGSTNGILVKDVAPLGPMGSGAGCSWQPGVDEAGASHAPLAAAPKLLPGDLVVAIGNPGDADLRKWRPPPVFDDGGVPDGESRKPLQEVVASLHPTQPVYVEIVRGGPRGQRAVLKCPMDAMPLQPLAPRFYGVDVYPEWLIVGGLLFTKASVPLLAELASRGDSAPVNQGILINKRMLEEYRSEPDEEVVVLCGTFPHPENQFYETRMMRAVSTINGEPVKNLKDMAKQVNEIWKRPAEKFLSIGFEGYATAANLVSETLPLTEAEAAAHLTPQAMMKQRVPDLVFKVESLREESTSILTMYNIPALMSYSLCADEADPLEGGMLDEPLTQRRCTDPGWKQEAATRRATIAKAATPVADKSVQFQPDPKQAAGSQERLALGGNGSHFAIVVNGVPSMGVLMPHPLNDMIVAPPHIVGAAPAAAHVMQMLTGGMSGNNTGFVGGSTQSIRSQGGGSMVVVSRGSGLPGRGRGSPSPMGELNRLNGMPNPWHVTRSFAEKAGEEAAADAGAADAKAGQKASFLEADPDKPKLAAAVQLDKEKDEGQATERRFGAKEATLAKKRALRADAEAKKAIPLHRVVKIYNTANVHNYMRPWNLGGTYSATGSGLLIKDDTVIDKLAGSKLVPELEQIKQVVGNVIVTNGHVVEDGVDFYVERTFTPGTDKLRAKVIAYARDADLAFLKVIKPEDEAALFDVGPNEVQITDEIPPLRTTVDVAGYPLGGNAVAVSQGQIARVNDFPFAFSIPGGTTNTPTSLPAAVVDAAVNPGNSGGPVFDANTGVCVGLAFASTTGAQGMNFVIPTIVMQMVLPKLYKQAYAFLESEAKCKAAVEKQQCGARACRLGEVPCRDVGAPILNEHLPTVPDLPLAWKPAENVGLREFLGLATKGGKNGVLVRSIAPLQAAELAATDATTGSKVLLKHGDVLTQIDVGPAGTRDWRTIDSRGFVEISGGGSKKETAEDSTEEVGFTQNNLRVQFEAVIAKKSCNGLPKPEGEDCDTIRLKFRSSTGLSPAGQSLEEAEREITFNARVLKQNAPRFDNMDAHPSWVVVGGFVFTRFSVPLFKQFGSTPPMPAMMQGLHNFHDKDESRDVVVLLDILSAPFNFDYDVPKLSVLSKINGEPVTKLEDVVTQTQKAWKAWAGAPSGPEVDISGFLRFEFQELGEELVKDEKAKARQLEHEEAIRPFGLTGQETKLPDVVLLFADIQTDFQEVIQKHQVPFPVDPDLIGAWCRPDAWGASPPQSFTLPVCHPDNQVAHEGGVFHGKGSLQSTALHRTKPIFQNGRLSHVAPAKGASSIEVDSGAQVATGLLEQKPQLKRFKVMA